MVRLLLLLLHLLLLFLLVLLLYVVPPRRQLLWPLPQLLPLPLLLLSLVVSACRAHDSLAAAAIRS